MDVLTVGGDLDPLDADLAAGDIDSLDGQFNGRESRNEPRFVTQIDAIDRGVGLVTQEEGIIVPGDPFNLGVAGNPEIHHPRIEGGAEEEEASVFFGRGHQTVVGERKS